MPENDTKNPLWSVSGGKKKEQEPPPPIMSNADIMSEFAPDPNMIIEDEEEVVDIVNPQPTQTVQPLTIERTTEGHKFDLPPRPPVRKKRNKKLRFSDIYTPITLNIDKRIAPQVLEYLSQGDTMTSFANQLFLKILIDAGYDLPLDLFTKPPR